MGLLDDAIREHLELKLKHGADPTEVDRLEHEALDPVPRGVRRPAPGAARTVPSARPAAPAATVKPPHLPVLQPTAEYDVVAANEADPPLDDLEETPEFLEETPEHDRLWFERKPPGDFDF